MSVSALGQRLSIKFSPLLLKAILIKETVEDPKTFGAHIGARISVARLPKLDRTLFLSVSAPRFRR